MAKQTKFEGLNNAIVPSNIPDEMITQGSSMAADDILYSTKDKEEYENKLKQYRQQKLLAYQWHKASIDNAADSLTGYTAIKLMYRDADLMDRDEIGAALDIISEEACVMNTKGVMLNIYSKSNRIRAILEDLFVNRLSIHTQLPLITRALCKYGNEFMLLNINQKNGVMGWQEMKVYEMDRVENGFNPGYGIAGLNQGEQITPDSLQFVRNGVNTNGGIPYKSWQIAHFRLIYDSFFLPYGVSILHKARRAWRMWSMMEDAMLIYRLDKSVERRVFKIYVGGIDNSDVQAFMQDMANEFKRTPIIDPETGQVDLRKNFLSVDQDIFIPVRGSDDASSVEALPSAQNPTSMDDINYMQNKIFAALRVPKTFLNFQEAQGKGQNLSFIDVRFSRMVNKIQQYVLLELNKIAMIHLYLIGFHDELSNFTLSLNNPSNQVEAQELDNLNKRLGILQTALSDPGNGIPMMSLHKGLREIMKMSDSEIADMLNEIRLEKAMAMELQQTANIIKHTGIFDTVDNIYGDFEALNNPQVAQQQVDNQDMGGGPGGGPGLPSLGGDDFGDVDNLGGPEDTGEGDISGNEGATPMNNATEAEEGGMLSEVKQKRGKVKSFMSQYFDLLKESEKNSKDYYEEPADFEGKGVFLNEQINNVFKKIDSIIGNDTIEEDSNEDIVSNEDYLIDEDEEIIEK